MVKVSNEERDAEIRCALQKALQPSDVDRGGLIEVEAVMVLSAAGSASAQTGWREPFDQTKGR